ncbi:HAD hydrolase-like protein [Salinarimonas ramus]|uniref:Phosphoglycolate phosphatase n=1 Tax=Salinarimonas ramus TaxID=690164 RepID=A0A917Q4D2_9HYPH|nr:HAD hydrolase-like protein [Salinarimonas ramus]GGK21582.1 phosphoglycolate phosphatase [Salinarimonas ramus]
MQTGPIPADAVAPLARAPWSLAVFDFDGTLADTLPWFLGILEELAARFDVELPRPLDVEAMRGLSAREIVARLRIPAWKLPLIARHVHARAAETQISLFPGTSAMLRTLHEAGIVLALVSSNGEAAVRRALGPRDAALVTHFACGAKLFGKARVFRAVTRRARVAPERVICIGDEIRDGEAAAAAGLAFGAVSWGYNDPDAILRATRPVRLFATPADIVEALVPATAEVAQARRFARR